jgi:hypothetical protein
MNIMQYQRSWKAVVVVVALILTTGPMVCQAAVTFEAESTSLGSGINMALVVQGEVKGYVDGERGRVNFASGKARSMPEGSAVVTGDGGQTSWLFDPRKKTCLKWPGQFRSVPSPSNAQIDNLAVKKVLKEDGPEIAGHKTAHYRFEARFDTKAANGSQWSSLLTEDFWVTEELDQPTLSFWLEKAPRAKVDPESLSSIADAMSVPGTVLKRTSKLTIEAQGGRNMESTATLEVTRIAEAEVEASDLEVPMACRNSVLERSQ